MLWPIRCLSFELANPVIGMWFEAHLGETKFAIYTFDHFKA